MYSIIRIPVYLVSISIAIFAGCGQPLPLKNSDPRIDEFSHKIADSCFYGENPEADITDDLVEFKRILDEEIFKGEDTPQTGNSRLSLIADPGNQLTSYPENADLPGAIVARPIAASLDRFNQALTWDDQVEVYSTERYVSYERTYDKGLEEKISFLNGEVNFLDCHNHVVDIGQRDISFAYDTYMTLRRIKNDSLPKEGVIILCVQMLDEATRVGGGYNAFFETMHSFHIYYPIDATNTYRVAASWVSAGGGLWIFGAEANSGNIGEGIVLEFDKITEWVLSGHH